MTEKALVRPRTGDVAAKVIDGEAIIMNLSSGLYYSMDRVGSEIWSLADSGRSVGEITDALESHYGVNRETVLKDVRALIAELQSEGLVDVAETKSGDNSPDRVSVSIDLSKEPYAAPDLNRYDDMADLLALDPPMPGLASNDYQA